MKERLIQLRKRHYTPAGKETINVYQEEIKKGHKELVKTGETNVYDMIQEDLEQSKIENILHRLAMGDLEALNQKDSFYVDTTTMPKSLKDAHNMILKAKAEFDKMPGEVKELFHNSADQYIEEMGTKEFLDKMAPYNKKMYEIAEAGNLKEYEKKVKAEAKYQKDVETAKGALVNE